MCKQNVVNRRFTVLNSLGLHARPASLFVRVASQFGAEIKVAKDGAEINGKSILGLMMLAAGEGAELEITACGDDGLEALDALEELFRGKFGEE